MKIGTRVKARVGLGLTLEDSNGRFVDHVPVGTVGTVVKAHQYMADELASDWFVVRFDGHETAEPGSFWEGEPLVAPCADEHVEVIG